MIEGKVYRVAGPVVVAEEMKNAKMFDVALIGEMNLMGEIIGLKGERATIQVYEETGGVGIGDKVISAGHPLSVELAPGLLGAIYDGIQRPLDVLKSKVGDFIARGVTAPAIDRTKQWDFVPTAKVGDTVTGGDILGVVNETQIFQHKIMVPPGVAGKIIDITGGKAKVEDTIASIETPAGRKDLQMLQRWPVRVGRPFAEKMQPTIPMLTGQRVLDTFFPVAKGGTACVPGPFGSGKTVIQHQLSKWADTDVIIFVGCGERGNEIAAVLMEFPELKDPKTGRPLMERTILVANTSNMPFAAREASIYTGITMAEYYRDMGYNVALQADSTSRWAEALREISGRLEEMPGEEGYPAYLTSRLASFYERAGSVKVIGSEDRTGSLTLIGAVSPPGGDFSEPVTQGTLRTTKVFWALDAPLAYKRHFPAIHWLNSYSLYLDDVKEWWEKNVGWNWKLTRDSAMALLQKEAELEEIVRLVGVDALGDKDRFLLECTRSIREDFLYQNAYHDVDTYCSASKQYHMLRTIMDFHELGKKALEEGRGLNQILSLPCRREIVKLRFVEEARFEDVVKALGESMQHQFDNMGVV
ncbi:MAG: V-type ATP synthase subunit A [Euryarchaeota archaeon]|nr:V-type ATP synthase subunit A [Euryarchaeota archaeon]MBU4033143.1 V-type ATP synthase subunit A [Candidatus Thermoplasmatota archaeon]MBU4072076.1 V-type ATP synthase subunit A [Candidatus Thermoplasmatota archaeon]MBU4143386.1 V-type ATP synthase subunit A [Candidatus Thermoplasmatota archaeon]